jgi:hypothetical protein
MGTLIVIAAVVLVGFAIFVLQQDATEQKRVPNRSGSARASGGRPPLSHKRAA